MKQVIAMNTNRNIRCVWAAFLTILLLIGCASQLGAQVYEKVYSFTDARVAASTPDRNRGSTPRGGLVQGSDGIFYGTTFSGGVNDLGTVFKVTSAGVLTVLVEFTGTNGSNKGTGPGAGPAAGLTQSRDGNFYGTTSAGGASGFGTIFRISPTGVLTTLVEFTDYSGPNPGRLPNDLLQGSDGNFYGTIWARVFKMTPAGVLTTLATLNGGTEAGLVQGSDGNFYGTTTGNDEKPATVFTMTPSGALTTLAEIPVGKWPSAALVQGSDGGFYGTTSKIGIDEAGTVFKVTPAGVLTTLVQFTG